METIVFFVIATIILLAFILAFYVFIKAGSGKLSRGDKQFIKKQWRNIVKEVPDNVHTAILNADKLLGYTLKLRGYIGSVGEQLKKSGNLFSSVNDVWFAHKTRNRIAHEMNVKITSQEGKKVIAIFKKALGELGIKL
ncbi:hypothetical protein J7J83_00755 [bacterium]|nr:hypothetical protein [bacterium]